MVDFNRYNQVDKAVAALRSIGVEARRGGKDRNPADIEILNAGRTDLISFSRTDGSDFWIVSLWTTPCGDTFNHPCEAVKAYIERELL